MRKILSFAFTWLAISLGALLLSGSVLAAPYDFDDDLVEDFVDNCQLVVNSDQSDADHDGRGTACDADLTQDLFVGGPDFTAYVLCFGPVVTPGCAAADLNQDGAVDRLDFPLLLAAFNGPPGPSAGAQLHGHVSARIADPTAGRSPDFRLPRITVFLEDVLTGRASRRAVTDPHGFFAIPRETVGEYRVCLEGIDFISSCDPLNVNLTHETHIRRDDYSIEPVGGGIFGAVVQRDPITLKESSCFRENSYFETLDQSIVTLMEEAGTPIRVVAANNLGEYLIPSLPAPGTYRLRATCGTRVSERLIQIQAGGSDHLEDFPLTNSSPKIGLLEARLGGNVVQVAAPGDLLQLSVVAVDPDGDPLHYKWRSETPGFVSQDSPNVSWPLPASPAENMVYLEVTDGSGGFATRRLMVSTGASGALFQGIVSDRDTGLPIAGATVTVGGLSDMSSAGGGFSIRSTRADRYVLNAEKIGYTFVSQIFHASTTGLNIRMRSQPVIPIDPTLETRLITSSERNALQGSLTIPPNCLVQRDGSPPPGGLNASFYTYDPTEVDGIPGDFSAIDAALNDVRLESFGAFGIDVWDPADATGDYNLDEGCMADFETEIPATMVDYAPASIPLLEYDPVRGYWDEVAAPATNIGGIFKGSVPFFSAWNTDVTLTDSACIKIEVDETSLIYPFKVRVTIPTGSPPGTGVDRIKEFPVTETPNGLFRLPPHSEIKIEIMDDSGSNFVYKAYLANSGAIVPAAFPPSPYSDCRGYDIAIGQSQLYVELNLDIPSHTSQWLSKKGGIYVSPGSQTLLSATAQIAETEEYYLQIDPSGQKTTLEDWLTENNFATPANGLPAVDEVEAVYYNNLDLKLGRQMHCRKTTGGVDDGDVACWVTNFGAPGGPPQDALAAAIDHLENGNGTPGATVTMEYDSDATSSAIADEVRFYVFDENGDRIPRVALDAEGAKPVPQICLVCHGGVYSVANNTVTGAAFREFDVFGFEFSNANSDYELGEPAVPPDPVNPPGQQDAFRRLNEMVKQTGPNVSSNSGISPITLLIDGLYAQGDPPHGVGTAGALAEEGYVPTGWNPPVPPALSTPESALYETITKVQCRACHIAQSSFIDFNAYQPFDNLKSLIEDDVCTDRTMPHAEAPFRNFWLSFDPSAANFLGGALGFVGACPTP